jgi:hypothetical protein
MASSQFFFGDGAGEQLQTVVHEMEVMYQVSPEKDAVGNCTLNIVVSQEGVPRDVRIVLFKNQTPLFVQLLDGAMLSDQVVAFPAMHDLANRRWGCELIRMDLPPDDNDDDSPKGSDWSPPDSSPEGSPRPPPITERRSVVVYFSTDADRAVFLAAVGYALMLGARLLEEVSFMPERGRLRGSMARPSAEIPLSEGDTVRFTVLAAVATPVSDVKSLAKKEKVNTVVFATTTIEERKHVQLDLESSVGESAGSVRAMLLGRRMISEGQLLVAAGQLGGPDDQQKPEQSHWALGGIPDTLLASAAEKSEGDSPAAGHRAPQAPVVWSYTLRCEGVMADKPLSLKKRLEMQAGDHVMLTATAAGDATRPRAGSNAVDQEQPSRAPPPATAADGTVVVSVPRRSKKSKRNVDMETEGQPAADENETAVEGAQTIAADGADPEADVETLVMVEETKRKLEKRKAKLAAVEARLKEESVAMEEKRANLESWESRLKTQESNLLLASTRQSQSVTPTSPQSIPPAALSTANDVDSGSPGSRSRRGGRDASPGGVNSHNDDPAAPLLSSGGPPMYTNDSFNFRIRFGYYDESKLPEAAYRQYPVTAWFLYIGTRTVATVGLSLTLIASIVLCLFTDAGRRRCWPVVVLSLLALIGTIVLRIQREKLIEALNKLTQLDTAAAVDLDRYGETTFSVDYERKNMFLYVATFNFLPIAVLVGAVVPIFMWLGFPGIFPDELEGIAMAGAIVGVSGSLISFSIPIIFYGLTAYTAYERVKFVVPIGELLEQRILLRTAVATYQLLKSMIQDLSRMWQWQLHLHLLSFLVTLIYAVYTGVLDRPYHQATMAGAVMTFVIASLGLGFLTSCLAGWDRATLDLVGNVSVNINRWSRGDIGGSTAGGLNKARVATLGMGPGTGQQGQTNSDVASNGSLAAIPPASQPRGPATGASSAAESGGTAIPVRGYGSNFRGNQTNNHTRPSDVSLSDFLQLQQYFHFCVVGDQCIEWLLLCLGGQRFGPPRWTLTCHRVWMYFFRVCILAGIIGFPIVIFYDPNQR